MILDAWHDAILSGRYAGVHYHCASASVAHWISRLAKKVRLSGPTFIAAIQISAEEIAALSPAADDVDELPVSKLQPSVGATPPRDEQVLAAGVRAPITPAPVPPEPAAAPAPEPETPEAAAERERRYREIFGPPRANNSPSVATLRRESRVCEKHEPGRRQPNPCSAVNPELGMKRRSRKRLVAAVAHSAVVLGNGPGRNGVLVRGSGRWSTRRSSPARDARALRPAPRHAVEL